MRERPAVSNPLTTAQAKRIGRVGGLLGGKSRSAAKVKASAVNGAKGGRPRKHPPKWLANLPEDLRARYQP